MTIPQSLAAYALAAGVLTLTPGLDTALVLRAATADGRRPAAGAALGITAGLLVWGSFVALGLGGLLAASATAYAALRWVGAAYLVLLGARLILKPRDGSDLEGRPERVGNATVRASFAKGLGTNLLNPKIGAFYVTFLPQFVPPGVPVGGYTFLLAALHALLGAVWFGALILAAAPLGRALRRPRVARFLDRATGGVFVAFGAKLAFSK